MVRPRPLAPILLAACTFRPSLDDPALSDRKLDLDAFCDGPVAASGQLQDIFGTGRRHHGDPLPATDAEP